MLSSQSHVEVFWELIACQDFSDSVRALRQQSVRPQLIQRLVHALEVRGVDGVFNDGTEDSVLDGFIVSHLGHVIDQVTNPVTDQLLSDTTQDASFGS
ncbi:hypothetical protein D3C86_1734200 [compost metagenome]